MFKFSLRLSVFTFLSFSLTKLAQLVNVYKKSNVKRDTNFAKTGQSSFRLTVQLEIETFARGQFKKLPWTSFFLCPSTVT